MESGREKIHMDLLVLRENKQKTSQGKRLMTHEDRGDGGRGGAGGVKGALTLLSIPFQVTSGYLKPQPCITFSKYKPTIKTNQDREGIQNTI